MYRGRDGFLIADTARPFEEAHTHGIHSLSVAKQIITNVSTQKRPDTPNPWLLWSHYRLSPCPRYRQLIVDLVHARREHRQPTLRRPR